MPIEERSRQLNAFSIPKERYQFRNLSFGLANAPAAFQQAKNVIFGTFARKNVLTFINDLLIVSEKWKERGRLLC